MLGRIKAVVAARQNGDGAGRETGMMSGGVDPASQTGRYRKTGFAELARWLTYDVPSALVTGSPLPPRPQRRARGLRLRRRN